MQGTPQVAFNPLTWYFTDDGMFDPVAARAPKLAEIYRQIREAGFDAVHAEVPTDMSVPDYRRLLDEAGLAPAPGYFQGPFEDRADLAETIELARRVAAEHAQLGLTRIFIAEQFGTATARLERPAIGHAADADRLARIIDNLASTAAAMTAEGVLPCLHPHVGTWIETGDEADAVLAAIDPQILLLGPDTGHLAWAGTDPATYIRKHLARIGAVHLKDWRGGVTKQARADNADYRTTITRHSWTEPGRGDVDFPAVLTALAEYKGWYVIEVDIADQPTPGDTARVSAGWVRDHFTTGTAEPEQ